MFLLMVTGNLEVCPNKCEPKTWLTNTGDLFDEADFGVPDSGNPDEIVIDTEPPRQQLPVPTTGSAPQRGPALQAGYNPAVVTPSKPERWNGSGPAGRPVPPIARQTPGAIPPPAAANGRPMSGQNPAQIIQNSRPPVPPQQQAGQNGQANNIAQPPIKRESFPGGNQEINPPQGTPSGGFYSARAVDLLRDNPNGASAAPQFDPHAESPSIRKTAGVDHTKSVPISRPMLSNASPAPNNNSRDYVNPAVDLQRKVGAPGSGFGSPVSRGPSVSSYRPLTRPNNGSNPAAMNRSSVPPQNLNGKRPPLIDVTNANASPGANPGPPVPGPNEPKRPRVSDADSSGPQPPTQ